MKKRKPKPCYVWVPMEPDGKLFPMAARKTRGEVVAEIWHTTNYGKATPVRCEVRPVKKGKP